MKIGLLNDILDTRYSLTKLKSGKTPALKEDGDPFCGERLYVFWQEIYEDTLCVKVELGKKAFVSDVVLNFATEKRSGARQLTLYNADKSRIYARHTAESGEVISKKELALTVGEEIDGFVLEFDVYFSSIVIENINIYGSEEKIIPVFPTPNVLSEGEGVMPLSALGALSVESELAKLASGVFCEKLEEKTSVKLERSGNGNVRFVLDSSIADNGYKLSVTKEGITLTASDVRGFVCAAETLIKLVGEDGISCCEIDDAPRMPFRGVHIMLPGTEDIAFAKRFIKYVVSPMGYNAVIIEFAGAMRFDSHPEIFDAVNDAKEKARRGEYPHYPHAEVGGLYGISKADAKDFVDYIKSFGIEVIPEVQSLGHVQFMTLAYPEIAEIEEETKEEKVNELIADVPPSKFYHHCYCPSNERSYEILFDLLDEIIEVTRPSQYVHMGHDEVYKMGVCPVCREKDPAELFAKDVCRIHAYLKQKGLKMMMWGDMLQPVSKYKTPPAIDMIPKDIVLLDFIWYFHFPKDIENNLLEKGFKVIFGNMYSSHFPRYESRIIKDGIVGAQPSAWVASNEKQLGKEGKIYEFLMSGQLLWSSEFTHKLDRVYDEKLKSLIPELRLALRDQKALTGDITSLYEQKVSFPPVQYEKAPEIKVGRKCEALIFKHTATEKLTRIPWGPLDLIGNYEISYADGTKAVIPVEYGNQIGHWKRRQNEPFKGEYYRHNGYFATYFTDGIESMLDDGTPVTVYRYEWRNPSPDKVIEKVTLTQSDNFDTDILLVALESI